MAEEEIKVEELVDEIEDFKLENTKATYEVWVLSTDDSDNATDFEYLIDDGYTERKEAMKCFDYFNDKDVILETLAAAGEKIPEPVKHLYLVVEYCIETEDGTECQDIIAESIII